MTSPSSASFGGLPALRSVEELFESSVRTASLQQWAEASNVHAEGLTSLPPVMLQTIGSLLPPDAFRAASTSCKSLHDALSYAAPGFRAIRKDGEISLFQWQAANVRRLTTLISEDGKKRHDTEGFVLCDAPGGGKTVSALATIARTAKPGAFRSTALVFAPKVIVPQWAAQIALHFEADVSGFELYCDDRQTHLYGTSVHPLTDRAAGSRGGVFLEQRPAANLPATDLLASFDIVVLAKELLSVRTSRHETGASWGKDKNDLHLRRLKPHTRLVIIDESHNISAAGGISNQLLNVEAFAGVPKLLMSGTPGTSPRRLYDMLALIRSVSWRNGGGFSKWSKTRFMSNSSSGGGVAQHAVRPQVEAALLVELCSCFLHTPAEVIFRRREPERATTRLKPSESEADSYNYVLSLHQRDVIRAGADSDKPTEWTRGNGKSGGGRSDWMQPRGKAAGDEGRKMEPSAEKTALELTLAVNGGEEWSAAVIKGGKPKMGLFDLPRDAPHYVHEVVVQRAVPKCDSCELYVPGLLTLPCACSHAICSECFAAEVGSNFGAKHLCEVCGGKRKAFGAWRATQPWFDVCTRADREHAEAQAKSTSFQHNQSTGPHGVHAILLRQPEPRPFTPLAAVQGQRPQSYLAAKEADATATERIRAVCEGYAKAEALALLLHRLRWPAGSQGEPTDAKVLIVPPTHKDVRDELISRLRAALGEDAIADLNNDKGRGGRASTAVETAKAIHKFRSGRGYYWQCDKCGEVYEESRPECSTATFRIRLDRQADDYLVPPTDTLRFINDCTKVDDDRRAHPNQTMFIGDKVAANRPGQGFRGPPLFTDTTNGADPIGSIIAMGSCNGKRPASSADGRGLIPAPAGSCFVLILNASGIEGLDLGEATHLIKTEPMARRDKELQAEARGRRLGDTSSLHIVQLLMAGTIEEATYDSLRKARQQPQQSPSRRPESFGGAVGASDGAEASSSDIATSPSPSKKRSRAEVEKEAKEDNDRRQAALLNSLKLLREAEPEEDVAEADRVPGA